MHSDPGRTQEYLDISANELQRAFVAGRQGAQFFSFRKKNQVEIRKKKFDLVELVREVMESMKPL